jgi:alpha-ketoglutarate-dependent 2,4-dichlorophenoxyacetate dioxygenase
MSTTFTTTYENTCPARPDAGVLRLRGSSEIIQHGSLTIKPVMVSENSAFGAEVSGIDWSRPVPPEVVRQVNLFANPNIDY